MAKGLQRRTRRDLSALELRGEDGSQIVRSGASQSHDLLFQTTQQAIPTLPLPAFAHVRRADGLGSTEYVRERHV